MTKKFPQSNLTVDMVVFALVDEQLKILLVKRKGDPFKGQWALPGGYVEIADNEVPDVAAARELLEETNVDATDVHMEQLHTFASGTRDPRGYTTSVSYFIVLPSDRTSEVEAGDDASDAGWFFVNEPENEEDMGKWIGNLDLAFDHDRIFTKGRDLLREKLGASNKIAFTFLASKFTQPQLKAAFEGIRNRSYERQGFARRFDTWVAKGYLRDTGESQKISRGRPPKLYTVDDEFLESL